MPLSAADYLVTLSAALPTATPDFIEWHLAKAQANEIITAYRTAQGVPMCWPSLSASPAGRAFAAIKKSILERRDALT